MLQLLVAVLKGAYRELSKLPHPRSPRSAAQTPNLVVPTRQFVRAAPYTYIPGVSTHLEIELFQRLLVIFHARLARNGSTNLQRNQVRTTT